MPSAKTFAANKSLPPLDGLVFPITGKDKNGADERSTQVTGKNCVAAALAAVDKEAAEACRNEKGWRFKYIKHIVKSVELSASSPEAALKVSAAGLKALHETFEFVRDGKTMSFAKAMSDIKSSFATGHIKGEKPKPASFELGVPYKGQTLTGDALQTQLDKWVRLGVIELSAGAQISQVARSAPWLDLSDRYFVLLGAGAAMGPFQLLLNHGANVIAVDLDRPEIWERLITAARNSCGSITFPLKEGTAQEKCSTAPGAVGADGKKSYGADSLYSKAGCNLFTQTPEIKNWVTTVHPGKQLVVGGYAFLPGDLFPRVSLAMDAIIAELVKQRKARARDSGARSGAIPAPFLHSLAAHPALPRARPPSPSSARRPTCTSCRPPPPPPPRRTSTARRCGPTSSRCSRRRARRRTRCAARTSASRSSPPPARRSTCATRSSRRRGRTTRWRSGSSTGGRCSRATRGASSRRTSRRRRRRCR